MEMQVRYSSLKKIRNMKKNNLLVLSFLFFAKITTAQIGISPTNLPPHASAMLDVTSTNKGLLIPRMTTAQRLAIASPANGLTVYDTNTLGFWFYNGTAWQNLLTVGNNLWLANGSDIYNSNSGNIGIGTNTPNAKMHIKSATTNALYKAETNNIVNYAGVELKSDGGVFDTFEMRKWAPGASGSVSGINLNGLSTLLTGAHTSAGLMVGTLTNQPLYFTANNKVRMKIKADGTVAIGNSPFSIPVKLDIQTADGDSIALSVENTGTTSTLLSYGITGTANAEKGVGIQGMTFRANLLPGVESTSYGLLGISSSFTTGNIPVSVGAFALEGTALRAKSESGYAIKSSGLLKLDGIGEGENKVLTSDFEGNATWQDASASSGWSKNVSGDIYNNPNNSVLIGSNVKNPGMTFYNMPVGLQVSNKKNTFFDNTGGDVTLKIINGGNYTDEPLEAGTAFYIKSPLGSAVNIDTRYTGIEVNTTAVNTLWSAGRFTLNNPISTANAFEIGNDGLGYALTVNNVGSYANAAGYFSNSNVTYTPTSNIDLELNNGYMKVSGNARTMFSVTTTAPTIVSNRVVLNYPGMSDSDMLVVTHNYIGNYIGATGVYWNGSAWTIFRQDLAAMPIGEKFNVLVVKQ